MAFFQTAMYKAMYERKFNASSEAASDADLEQFMYQYAVASVLACLRHSAHTSLAGPLHPSLRLLASQVAPPSLSLPPGPKSVPKLSFRPP